LVRILLAFPSLSFACYIVAWSLERMLAMVNGFSKDPFGGLGKKMNE
jgi:hypothetical protein